VTDGPGLPVLQPEGTVHHDPVFMADARADPDRHDVGPGGGCARR